MAPKSTELLVALAQGQTTGRGGMAEHRDPDDGMQAWERTSRSLHRNVDVICEVWPRAIEDINSIGFGTGRTYAARPRGGKSELTSVEAAAARQVEGGSPAFAFLAELGDLIIDLTCESLHPSGCPWSAENAAQALHDSVDRLMSELPVGRRWPTGPLDLVRRVEHLASKGAHWWPPIPKKGEVVQGVTVGERGSQAETCASCGEPVVSGRDEDGRVLMKQDGNGRSFHAVCFYELRLTPLRAGRQPKCSVENCDRPARARGWCQAHYDRWRKTGVIGGGVGVA